MPIKKFFVLLFAGNPINVAVYRFLTKTIRLSSSCSGVVTLIHNHDSYLLIPCCGIFFCQQPPENLGKKVKSPLEILLTVKVPHTLKLGR